MPVGAFAAVLALALAAPASPSPSPDPDPDAQRFKALVLAGEKAFAEGDLGAATWSFRQADLIRATPEVAFNLGKVHEALNDDPMAAYYYRLYLRRAPDAADALEVAEFLGDILARAESEGRGLVEVEAPTQGELTLAGRTWVDVPVATFLPPGDYVVTAKFGDRTDERTISVLTGRIASVRLEPYPAPLLDAEGRLHPLSVAQRGTQPSGARKILHRSSMVVAGLSAAAIAAGTVFGVSSASEAGRLTGPTRSALTVSEAQAQARSAGEKGAMANTLWAAGGAGLLLGGAVFVFTLPEPGGAR